MSESKIVHPLNITTDNPPLHYKTRMGNVTVTPMSVLSKGTFRGCYNQMRVWHDSDKEIMRHLIGYVRIVFEAENDRDFALVYIRPTWADDEFRHPLSSKSCMAALQRAYELLLLIHVVSNRPGTDRYALLRPGR